MIARFAGARDSPDGALLRACSMALKRDADRRWTTLGHRGRFARVTGKATAEQRLPQRLPQRLRDLALLRRVRDRIDREYAQPLDVEALARGEQHDPHPGAAPGGPTIAVMTGALRHR